MDLLCDTESGSLRKWVFVARVQARSRLARRFMQVRSYRGWVHDRRSHALEILAFPRMGITTLNDCLPTLSQWKDFCALHVSAWFDPILASRVFFPALAAIGLARARVFPKVKFSSRVLERNRPQYQYSLAPSSGIWLLRSSLSMLLRSRETRRQ